ncbi:HAD family hydrolase [Aquibacillus koreensis]|uniref:HAD family hydrolase n=1 Tax=Aquibacillus koreensis TaxID=279446 RepID=A0A9X3WKD6_9BACI|nr:HAD family hydrolase [Aquibacillus koreensis]MCT2537116.1 HAD family hydrolase [Aquibacillus koreensis]MDC3419901.1 HAD family hydrolase [Aquibacillus koreensis]
MEQSLKSTKKELTSILFDLDGTLLDSRDCIVNAAYDIVQKYYPQALSYQELLHCFGLDIADRLADIDISQKEIRKEFISIKLRSYPSNLLFPSVKEGLQKLVANGIRLGIVTNQQKDLVFQLLENTELKNMFHVIVTGDDVTHRKPDPEPIQQAIDKLGETNASVWMVGDTLYDLQAAHDAGVHSVLFQFYEKHTFDHHQVTPHFTFTCFQEFVDFAITYKRHACEDNKPKTTSKEGVHFG